MLESEIRKQIKAYMQLTGWFIFPIHQQGYMSYKGISDYIAVKDGNTIFVEVKTDKGKQSIDQKQFQQDIESHGGKYKIVRSIDDLVNLIYEGKK